MNTKLNTIYLLLFCLFCVRVHAEGGSLITMSIPIPRTQEGELIVPPSPSAVPGQDVRLITVYLPEEYDTSHERYPVIYYLPGLGGTNQSFAVGNKAILDDLISNKEIVPMIVVHCDPSLITGPTPQGTYTYLGSWYVNSALNGLFEDFMTQTTINYIDSTLRTKASNAYRAVMGQSMGAYGSMYLGMQHPELYLGFGCCSATPFWAFVTTPLATVPPDELYTINSFIQFEIPTSGPNAGKITPENGELTFSFFSYSAAFSPDLDALEGHPSNNFQATYFVDLPFLVNGDGTPVYTPGPVTAANPITGDPIVYPQSLVLNPSVVERWKLKDPYTISNDSNVIATLKKQAIYFDGGDTELANARGARLLSEKWATAQIDHEYVLFQGGHVDCLTSPLCSRHQTIFQMLSAMFSSNGEDANSIRSKIVGEGTLVISGNARMEINKGTLVGIETYPPDIDVTNITLRIEESGAVLIGTDQMNGGGLHIGNLISKAREFANPPLTVNTIEATIIIDGPQAQLSVGNQGFFGLAVGLVGQYPLMPNNWGMSSLLNVQSITLDIRQGVLEVDQIASGLEPFASVFALGPCNDYNFKIDPQRATLRGGSNMATIQDGWRLQPINITEPGILFPNGVRNVLDTTEPITNDYFYHANMASTGQYHNESTRNIISSSEQLDNRSVTTPFELTHATVDQFTSFLQAQFYLQQASKEGAIAFVNDSLRIVYLDTVNTLPSIVRTQAIPIGINQDINLQKVTEQGAVGIWVENANNVRQIISIDDLNPAC